MGAFVAEILYENGVSTVPVGEASDMTGTVETTFVYVISIDLI